MSAMATPPGELLRAAAAPVVVIEDDPGVVALLRDALAGGGYAVTATGTAVGALELVRRVRPCAVILDLGLPFRSGVALLAELTADPATAAVPVIVVSALTEQLSPERKALAAAVLAKPFGVQELLEALRAATRGE